jgi:hypothetical protein
VRPAALVRTAAERFAKGADAPFLACFDERVEVYSEGAVSSRPIVSSRTELGEWLRRLRKDHPRLNVTVTEPAEHGKGAVCDLILIRDVGPAEVWRLALGVFALDGLILEVRAFWSRERAEEWVAELW